MLSQGGRGRRIRYRGKGFIFEWEHRFKVIIVILVDELAVCFSHPYISFDCILEQEGFD